MPMILREAVSWNAGLARHATCIYFPCCSVLKSARFPVWQLAFGRESHDALSAIHSVYIGVPHGGTRWQRAQAPSYLPAYVAVASLGTPSPVLTACRDDSDEWRVARRRQRR